MLTRRALVRAGAAALVAPGVVKSDLASAIAAPNLAPDPRTLRGLAAARGFLFGTATATYELKDNDFVPALSREAAILVPEYEMKRHIVEPQPGVYDFSATDALLAFAGSHGMAMRAHPLIWYAANPPWLEQAVLARGDDRLLTGYVAALTGHYRGRMHSLDVVNEALAPDGSGWRQSFWLKRFGPAYVELAFHSAHAADPTALLAYNDNGCEAGGPVNDRMRANTLKLLDGLKARNVPIGALGLQSHLSAFGTRVDQRKLRDFLTEIEARGLTILVTELDVDDEGGPGDIASRDRAVADEAERFLDVALDNRATQAVLTWSLSDRYIDPPDSMRLRLSGWRDRRLPYDSQMRRKPLWDAMARAFAGRPANY